MQIVTPHQWVTIYVWKYAKLSLNYPCHHIFFGALTVGIGWFLKYWWGGKRLNFKLAGNQTRPLTPLPHSAKLFPAFWSLSSAFLSTGRFNFVLKVSKICEHIAFDYLYFELSNLFILHALYTDRNFQRKMIFFYVFIQFGIKCNQIWHNHVTIYGNDKSVNKSHIVKHKS